MQRPWRNSGNRDVEITSGGTNPKRYSRECVSVWMPRCLREISFLLFLLNDQPVCRVDWPDLHGRPWASSHIALSWLNAACLWASFEGWLLSPTSLSLLFVSSQSCDCLIFRKRQSLISVSDINVKVFFEKKYLKRKKKRKRKINYRCLINGPF